MEKIIFLVVFLVFIAACTTETEQNIVYIDNGNEKIVVNVEIADTPDETAKGLMSREFLDEDSGMWFVFDKEDYLSFWMKNTLIPLDIIFVSKDFEIIGIIYAEPCMEDPCDAYRPSRPAKYVLEVNGNFTVRNNIKLGDKVRIK